VSCFYNDLGIYNMELFAYTGTTFATSRLALFFIVFNVGFYLTGSFLANRPLVRRDYTLVAKDLRLGSLKVTAYFLALVLIGYVVFSYYVGGIPILQGMQRIIFLREAGPVQHFLLSYGAYIALALGYFRRPRGRFSVNGFLLVLMLLNLVLTGHKFSALIRLLVAYYTAVFARRWAENPSMKIWRARYIAVAAAGAVVLLAGAYASYTLMPSVKDAGKLLFDRVLALQGHLWWASDHNLFAHDRFDSDHWQAEWGAIVRLGQVPEGTAGMKYVMIQAIGADKAFPVFETGYRYTMAYPAILVLTFKYPVALALQFMAGCLLALLLYYLHYTLKYRHLIRALIALNVTLRLIEGVLGTGDFFQLIAPGNAFKLLFLLILELGVLRHVSSIASAGSREPAGHVAGKPG
ncbi:MAG: DUF6418 domain-containing protein, partial [Candidatus Zixiibacteriota bacterium]